MSYDYDDDDQQSGGALRDQLEKALKELKAAREENAKLSGTVKTVTLENILRDKQVPANIARWMKRDEVEPTADAVDKWIAENGEDFGYKPGQAPAQTDSVKTPEGEQSTSEEAPATVAQSVLSEEDIANYERITGLMAAGTSQHLPSDHTDTVVNGVAEKLGPEASFEDVIAELRSQGIAVESNFG